MEGERREKGFYFSTSFGVQRTTGPTALFLTLKAAEQKEDIPRRPKEEDPPMVALQEKSKWGPEGRGVKTLKKFGF